MSFQFDFVVYTDNLKDASNRVEPLVRYEAVPPPLLCFAVEGIAIKF
ncbi:MAG: hypothetical protein VX438_14130 [Planctomycetota bacterium]|nr:hypothetical protein [Planctomycetota bacterium]